MQGTQVQTQEAQADGSEGQGMEKLASELRLLRYLAQTALQDRQQGQQQQQQPSMQPGPGACEQGGACLPLHSSTMAPSPSASSEPAAPEHTLAPVMQALCNCVSSIERVLGTAYPLLSSEHSPPPTSAAPPPLAPRPLAPLSLSPTSSPMDAHASRVGAAGPRKGRVLVAMHSADHALQLLQRARRASEGDGPEPHITVRTILIAMHGYPTYPTYHMVLELGRSYCMPELLYIKSDSLWLW
jgi:hypothetical protein